MAGMLPNEFWEHEPADVVDYIQSREENQCREMYYSSVLTSRFIAMQISNMFSKSRRDLPQYDEIFNQPTTWEQSLENRVNQIRSKFGGYISGR